MVDERASRFVQVILLQAFTNVDYTPDSFQSYIDWIVDVNAETRSDVVIDQMRAANLFPDHDAPVFNQHGGRVAPGFGLATLPTRAISTTRPTAATRACRVAGSIPAQLSFPAGWSVSPVSRRGRIGSTTMMGRISGPLGARRLTMTRPGSPALPRSGSAVSGTRRSLPPEPRPGGVGGIRRADEHLRPQISLAGVEFTNGITFSFDDGDTLAPGARAVLVSDPTAFTAAYAGGATA